MTKELPKHLKNHLFLDIETVAAHSSYDQLDPRLQKLWDKKADKVRKGDDERTSSELFYEQGAIYAEFGRVVTIAFGAFIIKEEELTLKVSSYSNTDEAALLLEFKALLEKYNPRDLVLCAHNGKEFDFPYLCRRMLINGIELPETLKIAGKKPWEIPHKDTLELWKFGDFKNFTSLDLLAAVFDIPGSKNEMNGAEVTPTFYEQNDLEKINRYCREDVVVLAQLYLKLHSQRLVAEHNITRVE